MQIRREICEDTVDTRYGTEIGTSFVCGAGDMRVGCYFPDASTNRYNAPELITLGDSFAPELVEQALPNIMTVLNDPRVQQRRDAK